MLQATRGEPLLFLFDIDGTLLRSGTQVHRDAFAHAYRTVYHLELSLDGISAGGRTDTWLLAEPLRRAGWPDEAIWEGMSEAFAAMEAYVAAELGDLRHCVLPGVHDVLALLHDSTHLLGLVTGNLAPIAQQKLAHAGLGGYFDTGGFGEESEVRAHLVPVALAKAGEAAGHAIPPHRAVIIGDTPLDIEAGRLTGTRTVGVATGPCSIDELTAARPDLVFSSLEDSEAVYRSLTHLGEDA